MKFNIDFLGLRFPGDITIDSERNGYVYKGFYGTHDYLLRDTLAEHIVLEDERIREHLRTKPYYIQQNVVKKVLAVKLMEVISLTNVVFFNYRGTDMFALYPKEQRGDAVYGEMTTIIQLDDILSNRRR